MPRAVPSAWSYRTQKLKWRPYFFISAIDSVFFCRAIQQGPPWTSFALRIDIDINLIDFPMELFWCKTSSRALSPSWAKYDTVQPKMYDIKKLWPYCRYITHESERRSEIWAKIDKSSVMVGLVPSPDFIFKHGHSYESCWYWSDETFPQL